MPNKKSISKKDALAMVPKKSTSAGTEITYMQYSGTPNEVLMAIADEYGIRAEFGDVKLYNGKPYFTKAGLKRIASAQKVKSVMPKVINFNLSEGWAQTECIITCASGEVCRDYGFCDRSEPGKNNKSFHDIQAIALTRATRRALILATSVPNCPEEDLPLEMRENVIELVPDEGEDYTEY